jgi:hypothetical protein
METPPIACDGDLRGASAANGAQLAARERPEADGAPPPPAELIVRARKDAAADEAAFLDAIAAAADPAPVLNLAGVPLTARCGDGCTLTLLTIETGLTIEVGHLTVADDDENHSYVALPADQVARRRRLSLVYHDGVRLIPLTLAEARALAQLAPAD